MEVIIDIEASDAQAFPAVDAFVFLLRSIDIYCGVGRKFREGLGVAPFRIVTSEVRRIDRKGLTPVHILYMAMKIFRL